MYKITVSAPGKLLLFGEHAVVYGQPAIVSAVDKRLSIIVEEVTDSQIIINAPEAFDTRFIDAILSQYSITKGLRITTASAFSGKYGFGSSSAVTVALCKALSELMGKQLSDQELFQQAFKIISQVQGTGSGVDIAASIFGGTIFYQKNPLMIEPLAPDWNQIAFVVGYSGIKANTVEIIRELKQKHDKEPEKFAKIMNAIGSLVNQAKESLTENDWERVGKYMNFNQEYLRDLGVSNQKLEDMILAAKKSGAFGAKLSGAGGGDSIIALVAMDKKTDVENAIAQAGGEIVESYIGSEGVKIEEII